MLPSLAGLTLRTEVVWDDYEYQAWIAPRHAGVLSELMEASKAGQVNLVKHLLNGGARVDDADLTGETALMYASREGHVAVVKLLLDRGAGIDKQEEEGETALMFACRHGHVDVVRLLLDRGAEVDKTDIEGWTALHIASINGRNDSVKVLLERGANPDKKTHDNRAMARLTGYDETLKIIEDAKGIRVRYFIRRWRAYFHARAFWRYWYFRAVGRVLVPGNPGYDEAMYEIKKLFREMGYTSMSFSDFLRARVRGSAFGHARRGVATPSPRARH